ncbi:unnamed protein product, partial [Rotaria magnacalcarata]
MLFQWLNDIINGLNYAEFTDDQKVSIISGYVNGDARRWLLKNLFVLDSWSTFIQEFKKEFAPTLLKEDAMSQVNECVYELDETMLWYDNGNSMVIYVAIRKKKYRNVTNCYVINLAVADLLFLTVAIPYTTYLGLVKDYTFGETICKIYMSLSYVFLLATCNTLAAMSIDRCLYIVLPTTKLQSRTPQTALIVCIFIWTGSLALIVPFHIIFHRATSNVTCGGNNHSNFLVCFAIFSSYYALPLFIIIVCYTKLAMHVMQSNRLTASQMKNKMVPKSLKTKQQHVTRM